jgi:hypothetical protein
LARQQTLELRGEVVSFESFGEGSEERSDAFDVQIRVRVEESFDVSNVAWPQCEGLHHDEVLGGGDAKGYSPDRALDRPFNDLSLEWQARERQIDLDTAGVVPEKQDA